MRCPGLSGLALTLLALGAARPQAQETGANQPPAIVLEAATRCVRLHARPKVCAFVLDDKGVGQVRAVFRSSGRPHYYWMVMGFDGARYCAWLPAPSTETTAIEYYVEAFDEEYELSRSRSEMIEVSKGCPLPDDPPKTPATVRPAASGQAALPPGFDPDTLANP